MLRGETIMGIDPKTIVDAAQAAGDLLPEIYRDVAKPAASEVGHTLGGVVRLALSPLNALVWGYKRIETWLETKIEEKLAGVPKERIVSPPLMIAGPVVQALPFAAHDDELREMFANLLATAMDSATQRRAHPSFVDVIRQITSDEAKVLRKFVSNERQPVVDLMYTLKNSGGTLPGIRTFALTGFNAGCARPDDINVYFDNLHRLGILAWSPFGSFLVLREDHYPQLENHEIMSAAKKRLEANPLVERTYFDRKYVEVTEYGREFIAACVAPQHPG
jgi:hypothetical protein